MRGGGTRTPAPQSWRHSRPGPGARDGNGQRDRRKVRTRWQGAQGTGGRATGHGIAAWGRRCPGRIAPSMRRARRKGLAPWSSHGPRRYRQIHRGRRTSGTTGAVSATVKHHHSKGLRFRARCTRAASWTLPKQLQCAGEARPLKARKLPVSEPRDASDAISPGVDMASFYLWVRAELGAGNLIRFQSHCSWTDRPWQPNRREDQTAYSRCSRT